MVNIAHLKNNLSRHLARVRRGGQITVCDRDTPIARIVPLSAGMDALGTDGAAPEAEERIAGLVREGVLSPGNPRAVSDWVAARKPVRLPAGSPGAVDALTRMRRESAR